MSPTPSPDSTVRERHWTETQILSFNPAPSGWWIPHVWLDDEDHFHLETVPIIGWALTEEVPVRALVNDANRDDRSRWKMADSDIGGGPIELVQRNVEPVVALPGGGGICLASDDQASLLEFPSHVLPPGHQLTDAEQVNLERRLRERYRASEHPDS